MTSSKAHAATFALTLRTLRIGSALLFSSLALPIGCRRQVEIGGLETTETPRDSGSTRRDSGSGDSGSGNPDAAGIDAMAADASGCVPVRCRGGVRACADCLDNDADGVSDSEDPDCWSPCDDTEDTLSGTTQLCPESDCFFDPDCGGGNDQACIELTPNGCDCHGCCALPDGSGAVLLGSRAADESSSCTSSALNDPSLCQPCTPDAQCLNTCDHCESCFGAPNLGAECVNDSGCAVPTCDEGRTPCGGCAGVCTANEVCVSGCCATPR